jgi:hypothetical protein
MREETARKNRAIRLEWYLVNVLLDLIFQIAGKKYGSSRKRVPGSMEVIQA